MESNGTTRLVERIRSAFESQADILFSYLFGSVAKGQAGTASDIDVAVLLHEGSANAQGSRGGDRDREAGRRAKRALALEGELERMLGRYVQVVALNDAPIGLVHNVLKTGLLISTSDDAARRRFFVGHARRYFDMEPARRIFDRYRSRRIEEGTFGGGERHGT